MMQNLQRSGTVVAGPLGVFTPVGDDLAASTIVARSLPAAARVEAEQRLQQDARWASHLGDRIALQPVAGEAIDRSQPHPRLLLHRGAFRSLAETGPPANSVLSILEAARAIALVVARLHSLGFVHAALCPQSIWLRDDADTARLAALDLCFTDAGEVPLRLQRSRPVDLRYLAPEMWGSAEDVDRRADLYALGVVFHEMLTGRLPHAETDAVRLRHAHSAIVPARLETLRPDIPGSLGDIVAALLSKDPAQRYGSARGLAEDLGRIAHALSNPAAAPPALQGRDLRDRPCRPDALAGRDAERHALIELLHRPEPGAFALVSAPSGSGKTVLVEHAFADRRDTRLVSWGKSDQSRLAEPFSTLAAPLEELLAKFERSYPSAWQRFCADARDTLGACGAALAAVLRGQADWLDPGAGNAPLPDRAGQGRLQQGFRVLLEALAGTGVPMALVLDDMQWADPGSTVLLHSLASVEAPPGILIVGLYRDDEVVEDTATHEALAAISSHPCLALHLALRPLDGDAVAAIVAESLGQAPDAVRELADRVHAHSRGNPLFVVEELQELWRRGTIRLDGETGSWTWNEAALSTPPYSSELSSLIQTRFRHLPADTQSLMATAACFGRDLDADVLARIRGGGETGDIAIALSPALRDGLLLPAAGGKLRFRHDQVQSAAYALLQPAQRYRTHLAIAEDLLGDNDRQSPHLLEAIGHLNTAAPLLQEEGRGRWLALCNLEAARLAAARGAFGDAWSYLQVALSVLDSGDWHGDYETMRDVHMLASRVGCMSNAAPAALSLSQAAQQHARDRQDRVAAIEASIEACKVLDRFVEGLEAGIEALSLLGVDLDPDPTRPAALLRLLRTHAAILHRGTRHLAGLAPMRSADALAAMRILAKLGTVSFLTRPALFLTVVDAQLRLTLQHGIAPESANALALHGVVVLGVLHQVSAAQRIADAAIDLTNRCEEQQKPRATMVIWIFLMPWRESVADCLEWCRRGCRAALAAGDPEFANYHASGYAAFASHAGPTLAEAIAEMEWMRARVGSIGQRRQYAADIYHQMCLNLMGGPGDPMTLAGPIYDAAVHGPLHADAPEMNGHVALVELMLAVHLDRPERHGETIRAFRAASGAFVGMYMKAAFAFYEAISALRFEAGARARQRARWNLLRIRRWARRSPANFQHKAHFLEAELSRAAGRWAEATALYEKAARGAAETSFRLEAGLALEGAHRMALLRGLPELATHYLDRALAAYADAGALAVVRSLSVRAGRAIHEKPVAASGKTAREVKGDWDRAPDSVDLAAVLEASLALSEGMELDSTIERILRTIVGVSGAQRGFLLDRESAGFAVLARGETHGAVLNVHVSPAGEPAADLVAPAVLTEVSRTGQPLILSDPGTDSRFRTDPWFAEHAPRSLLCCPLRRGEHDAGLLYLEHRMRADAFGPRELETVRLLSMQAAISLDNARLYARQLRLSSGARRFVPQEFLQLLGKGDVDEVALSDHVEAEMTILVCDIRGFTTATEYMTPQASFAWVNEFFAMVGPLMREHGGFVMKYMGDGLMGVFPGHPDDAVRASLAILKRLAGVAGPSVGIGLHTGPVSVGAVGEQSRIQGDVMSDVANVATRLEALTRTENVAVVLSEATLQRLSPGLHPLARPLGEVALKGRSGLLVVHALEPDRVP